MNEFSPRFAYKSKSSKINERYSFNPRQDKQQVLNEQGEHQSLLAEKLKRQRQLQYQEKADKIHKKKNVYHLNFDQDEMQLNQKSTRRQQQKQANYQNKSAKIQLNGLILKDNQKQEVQSFELLKCLTESFILKKEKLNDQVINHKQQMNKKNKKQFKSRINLNVLNQFIIKQQTSDKLKSILMLYFILFQMDEVGFKFVKKINRHNSFTKTIQIKPFNLRPVQQQIKESLQYQKFIMNQQRNYLANYLEWLITRNESKFQKDSKDKDFWALALNNCQQTSHSLIKFQNNERQNTLKALYMSNFQDEAFKNLNILIAKEHNVFIKIKNDCLDLLPICHWMLGLNISIKYFHAKQLKQCISQSINTYTPNEEVLFYHEYQLLSAFVNGRLLDQPNANTILSDHIIAWIITQTGCLNKNDIQQIFQLTQKICQSLLTKSIKDKTNLKQNIIVTTKLLDIQNYLDINKKCQILTDLLFKKQKIAEKLGDDFSHAINEIKQQNLKNHKSSQLYKLFEDAYQHNFKHILRSQYYSKQKDLLSQARSLFQIDLKYRTFNKQYFFDNIITSPQLLSHWNKTVVMTFMDLLRQYNQKIKLYIDQKSNSKDYKQETQNSKQPNNKPRQKHNQDHQEKAKVQTLQRIYKQINSVISFIKIQLSLKVLTVNKVIQIADVIILATNKQTKLVFKPQTVNYMRSKLLQFIFNRQSSLYLLTQISDYINSPVQVQIYQPQALVQQIKQQSKDKKPQKADILAKLSKIANGNSIFQKQIKLFASQIKASKSLNNHI